MGLFVLAASSTNDDTAYPFCVCCGVKVSRDEYLAFLMWERQVCQPLRHFGCGNKSITCNAANYM